MSDKPETIMHEGKEIEHYHFEKSELYDAFEVYICVDCGADSDSLEGIKHRPGCAPPDPKWFPSKEQYEQEMEADREYEEYLAKGADNA